MLPTGNTPTNEAQARELSPLLDRPDDLRDAWQQANDQTDGKPTAAAIRSIVRPSPPPVAPAGGEAVVTETTKTTETFTIDRETGEIGEPRPWQPPPPSPESQADRAREISREAWSRNLAHHAHFFARLAIGTDGAVRQQARDFLPAFAGPFEQVTPDVLRDAARYLTALADAWQQERAA